MGRKLLIILVLFTGLSGYLLFRHVTNVSAASTITVNSTADTSVDDGVCTLREAITAANTDSASGVTVGECAAGSGAGDTIEFDISGVGPHTLTPATAYPNITTSMIIDGYSEPDATENSAAAPAALNGTLAVDIDASGYAGWIFQIISDSVTIRGLVMRGTNNAVNITGSSNTVAGNYMGTNVAGTTGDGFGEDAVRINSGSDNLIGGTDPEDRNVMADSPFGIRVYGPSDSTMIQGNLIGVGSDGSTDLGNNYGIHLSGSDFNNIGGLNGANVISGSTTDGIHVTGSSSNNVVAGNYIGLGSDGATIIANGNNGISMYDTTTNNIVGGDSAAERNVISGNATGVSISSNSNTVSGNYIGTDVTGELDRGNTNSGVLIFDVGVSNTIGGDSTAERNVISGNGTDGVRIIEASSLNIVSGNYVGTDDDGLQAIANSERGVMISDSEGNTIGGSAAGTGNLISGNTLDGVFIIGEDSDDNTIQGNLIGTTGAGTAALANGDAGITITSGGDNNLIGGTTANERNVISANSDSGISVISATTTGTTITGNYIGTSADGTADLGNGDDGISTASSAPAVTIGGATSGAGNVISGNAQDGIYLISSATGSTIRGNYIGTNAAGTAAIANGRHGVYLFLVDSVTVGGTTAEARNVIAGNTSSGINIESSDSGTIQGNYVGLNSAGTAAIANAEGIVMPGSSNSNQIGGTASGAGNVVSGNSANGIGVQGNSNVVKGNLIGLSANGLTQVANCTTANSGSLSIQGSNNIVGDGTAAGRNVVASCNAAALNATLRVLGGFGGGANGGNVFQGNYIGTDINGQPAGSVGAPGLAIVGDTLNNLFGGVSPGQGNLIRGNGAGIWTISLTPFEATNNSFIGNSIYENAGSAISELGVDLFESPDFGSSFLELGVTPNDVGDPDESTNHYMNFPVISNASSSNGTVDITYSLDINDAEVGATGYRVEFFANDSADPSGHGQGQIYLGADTVAGDVTNKTVTLTLPAGVSGAKFLSATTTMTDGSTDGFGHSSEFSANLMAVLQAATGGSGSGTVNLADTGKAIMVITALAVASISIGLYVLQRSKAYTSGK